MVALDPHTGLRKMSIREAAAAFSLAYTTLRYRLAGSQQRGAIAHERRRLLTPVDEKEVLRWIAKLENWGFPPNIDRIEEAAKLLSGSEVGKNWITRFLNCHPQLATKFTTHCIVLYCICSPY